MTLAEDFLKERGLEVAKMNGYFDYDFKAIDMMTTMTSMASRYKVRNDFIAKFGFCVLTNEIAKTVAAYEPLIEVGAGSGYWAYEIKRAGGDIIATDPGTGCYHASIGWNEPWTNIERIFGVEAVTRYPEHTLLTVWPDYDVTWPYETLRAYNGDIVLYAGEYRGCTADDTFHDLLEEKFEEVEHISVPQFDGMHDYLGIYRRI